MGGPKVSGSSPADFDLFKRFRRTSPAIFSRSFDMNMPDANNERSPVFVTYTYVTIRQLKL